MFIKFKHVLFFCFLFCCLPLCLHGQKSALEDYEFIKYLIGNDMKDNALTWAKREFTDTYYQKEAWDSIHFIRGWAFYSNKILDSASLSFDRVKNISLKPAAVFFSSLCLAYNRENNKSIRKLLANKNVIHTHKELYSFEMAGYSLLKRDFLSYQTYGQDFTYSSYILADKEKELDSIYTILREGKIKSPLFAAALSAIIPGLGKIYLGNLGEGISSFITVGVFSSICAENWIKHGFYNWKTILFGSLASIFYVGNIYGSYFGVKLSTDEFNNNQNLNILYNIHIPLRNTFGL